MFPMFPMFPFGPPSYGWAPPPPPPRPTFDGKAYADLNSTRASLNGVNPYNMNPGDEAAVSAQAKALAGDLGSMGPRFARVADSLNRGASAIDAAIADGSINNPWKSYSLMSGVNRDLSTAENMNFSNIRSNAADMFRANFPPMFGPFSGCYGDSGHHAYRPPAYPMPFSPYGY